VRGLVSVLALRVPGGRTARCCARRALAGGRGTAQQPRHVLLAGALRGKDDVFGRAVVVSTQDLSDGTELEV
jgi:hypothetical protein